jgi:hypothetical protein
MAINGPKGAHPTSRGWVSAKGELLKSQRITEAQIAEWNEAMNPSPKPQVLREAPVTVEEVIEEHFEDIDAKEIIEKKKPKRSKKLFDFS